MTDFDTSPELDQPEEVQTEKQPAATAVSRRLAPGGGGGGAWLGGPKTASSEKFGNTGKKSDFHLLGTDLFGEELRADATGIIREKFDFPPFSVLNAREGAWQDRKRAWLSIGIQSEVGRGENLLKMSDTMLEPDPEKRAAKGGLTWGISDIDEMRHKEEARSSGDAQTFGSGAPGDLARQFKARAITGERNVIGEMTQKIMDQGAGSGTSIFDPVLAELCYKWFCPPGGMIVDPFAGGSVRGIVAGMLGFQYHGIDLRPEQIAANEAQRQMICPDAPINWVVGDSNLMLPKAPDADFIFSCPPYGDLEQYSDDPNDLSAMTWEGFVGMYRHIIRKSVERLKPNRFACFVIGEYRDKQTGLYRGFVPLTCASFMAAGAALYNEAILITSVGSLALRVTKQFETSRKMGKTHQNIIICVKGDPKIATEAIMGRGGAAPAQAPAGPPRIFTPAMAAPSPAPGAPAAPAAAPGAGATPYVPPPLPGPAPAASPPTAGVDSLLNGVAPPQVQSARAVSVGSAGSMAEFLGTTPLRGRPDWVAQAPPSLDGIHDIILNYETDGLDWRAGHRPVGVTVSTLDGQLNRFLPFGFRGGGNLDEAALKEWARRELRGKHITNANTRFDIHMSREWGIDLEEQGNTVSDVQHYAALLDDHRKKFSIDVLAKDYLGGIEVGRIDERMMAEHSAGEVAARAEYQTTLVRQLREKMWPLLDAQELQQVRQLEDEVIYPVVEMEKNGAPIDVELMEQCYEECTRRSQDMLLEISREVGFSFEVSAAGWQRLFEYCHLTPRNSYAEDVIAEVEHPLVQKAHLAGQYASLNSKTFAAYRRQLINGVLYYDINQLRGDEGGTVSGRFSIGYVQQAPNHDNHHTVFGEGDVETCDHNLCYLFPRRVFIPGSGRYLAADAAQIEYRIFAHFASNPKVLEAYAQNPHMSFHKFIWGMMKEHRPDMKYSWQKNLNFMKMYGGGLAKLALMMGFITKQQFAEIQSDPDNSRKWRDPALAPAVEIQRIYENMMPEVAPLQARASHLAKSQCDADCTRMGKHQAYLRQLHKEFPHRGYVKTIAGRRSRFPNNWKTYRGLNRVIQGSAADVMKQKLVELHRERKQTGFVLRMTVHDEVGGDSPTPECKAMVNEILNRQSFPQLKVPILWETNDGVNWAEAK